MNGFWIVMYFSQPYLLLLGMSGCLGETAKKTAEDLASGFEKVVTALIAIGIIVWVVQLILKKLGIV